MNIETLLLTALIVGLFGSLHCAGMCGGIASALGMSMKQQASDNDKVLYAALFFQLGRLSSYAIAGFVAGSIGDILTQSEIIKNIATYLRLFSALFIIALGFYLAGLMPFFALIEKMGVPVWKKIAPLSRHLLPVTRLSQAYGLGLLWGWLPCGLTYSILLWSVAAGSGIEGSLLMLAFGIGTLPAMLSITLGASKITGLLKQPLIRRVVGLLMVVGGVLILMNIMALFGTEHIH